jgi:hypothetical protein
MSFISQKMKSISPDAYPLSSLEVEEVCVCVHFEHFEKGILVMMPKMILLLLLETICLYNEHLTRKLNCVNWVTGWLHNHRLLRNYSNIHSGM